MTIHNTVDFNNPPDNGEADKSEKPQSLFASMFEKVQDITFKPTANDHRPNNDLRSNVAMPLADNNFANNVIAVTDNKQAVPVADAVSTVIDATSDAKPIELFRNDITSAPAYSARLAGDSRHTASLQYALASLTNLTNPAKAGYNNLDIPNPFAVQPRQKYLTGSNQTSANSSFASSASTLLYGAAAAGAPGATAAAGIFNSGILLAYRPSWHHGFLNALRTGNIAFGMGNKSIIKEEKDIDEDEEEQTEKK